jgi:hypothetical protein
MVTVLLATMVMVSLSVAAYQLSIGNLSHSAYDQKRDQALQAAQGAVNSYLAALPRTAKVCNGVGTTNTLSTKPSITYSVSRVAWLPKGGSTYTKCSSSSPPTSTTLAQLVITGTGTAGVSSSGTAPVTRKWQTLVDLTPVSGGSAAAFYGNTGLCISNNPTLIHDVAGNDALLYSGGDINTTSLCGAINSGASMVIEGNLYAQGNIDGIQGCIDGNVWAGGSINLATKSVGSCTGSAYPAGFSITANAPPNPTCNGAGSNTCIFSDNSGNSYGDTTAAGGSLSLQGSANYGYCRSSGSMSFSSSRCSRNRDPGDAFMPAACSGTVGDGSTGCGTSNMAGLTAPPALDVPIFTYTASDWSPAYTVVNETSGNCSTIVSDITSKISTGVGGKYDLLFYINPGCALSWPSNNSYALQGNTIIVTTGSFSSSGNTTLSTASGSCGSNATDNYGNPLYPSQLCQFDVIVPTSTVANPTSSCVPPSSDPGTWDISFGNSTDMSGVDAINYTPCQLTLGQSTNINGQGIAGVINESNHFNMSFHALSIPGFSPIGYNAAPRFFRECNSPTDTTGYC